MNTHLQKSADTHHKLASKHIYQVLALKPGEKICSTFPNHHLAYVTNVFPDKVKVDNVYHYLPFHDICLQHFKVSNVLK
jgi:hypothetical protein